MALPGDDGLNSSSNIHSNTPCVSSTDQIISQRFLIGLLCYFAAHIFLRTVVSSSLETDEAEQVLFSQWLRASYLSKPPLYTWLQILFFKLFGTNVLALSLLKNGLLFSTYAFVFAGARLLFNDARLAVLATLSLLLIPQISWESQRDLTHSILVTALSAMSFYVVLRLLQSQCSRDYVWLGVAIGFGTLAKYNFALFIAAVLITLLTYARGRSVLSDRRALLTLAAVLIIVLPYAGWVVFHLDSVTSSLHDLDIGPSNYFVKGTGRLIYVTLMFLGPLCLVYLLLFPRGFSMILRHHPMHRTSFPVQRYFLALFCLLWVMILVWRVTYFKDRWMQPLFFLFPLYFFTYVKDTSSHPRASRVFLALALLTASTILVMMPARIVLGPSLGYYTAFNFPYAALADKIEEQCSVPNMILADSQLDAGNIRLQLPDSLVLASNLTGLDSDRRSAEGCLVAFWKSTKTDGMPDRLKTFLRNEVRVAPHQFNIVYHDLPYKYADKEHVRVGIAVMQPPD